MESLGRAREAFVARRWVAAYEAFRGCERLGGRDFDAVAEAAHWLGRPDESIVFYTDAYSAHLDAGEERRAALSALLVSCHLRFLWAQAEADGWVARAGRLLEDAEEGAEHGYPLHFELPSILLVDPVRAVEAARRMQELGGLYGDGSLVAIIDTWDTVGLRGTGSHDIEVAGAFVPAHRVIPIDMSNPTHDGALSGSPW